LAIASSKKPSNMMNTIQIPTPCHQDWDAMTANEQGRHCLQCCKTVVDFTEQEPEAIIQYLKAHTGQSVCGRFTAAQITMPVADAEVISFHIFNSSLSYFKKIAALILITFGIVVTNSNKSYSQTVKTDTTQNSKSDTGFLNPMMVGEIEYMPPHPTHKPKIVKKKPIKKANCHIKKAPATTEPLMGKVAITPTPVIMGDVQVKDENQ